MQWLRREQRRLRKKYLRLSRHRRNPSRLGDWVERETYRCALPLLPGAVVFVFNGPSTLATVLLIMGLAVAVPWIVFVHWQLLLVYARKRDKTYRLVTRNHLSREYREDPPKPQPRQPITWDDVA